MMAEIVPSPKLITGKEYDEHLRDVERGTYQRWPAGCTYPPVGLLDQPEYDALNEQACELNILVGQLGCLLIDLRRSRSYWLSLSKDDSPMPSLLPSVRSRYARAGHALSASIDEVMQEHAKQMRDLGACRERMAELERAYRAAIPVREEDRYSGLGPDEFNQRYVNG